MNDKVSIQNKTFIFLDESGKPEVYSAKGINLVTEGLATKFLVLCAIRCSDQLKLQQEVMNFKVDLLKDEKLIKVFSSAYTLDTFHAHVDYPEVKERFYGFINRLDIKIDVMVIDKLQCFPALRQNPGRLYGVMAGQLLKNICHQSEKTEIIFSRKDSKLKSRKEIEIEVEKVRIEYLQDHPNLKQEFKLSYFHNPHYTHGGLQVADYIAYAVYQVFERNNREWYLLIKDKIGKIHDICNKKYFTRSNPL
jgi:hypothetical protein